MERRRLAVILSHLSAKTNQPRSWGDCGRMQRMPLQREGCGGKEGDANETDEFGVCCRENVTGNSNSVVKTEEFSVEQGVGCNGRVYDAKEQCSEMSKGVVRSHMTRSMEIVKEDEENCVFCDVVRGRAPALKLYEDETCLCILDINPLSHGYGCNYNSCNVEALTYHSKNSFFIFRGYSFSSSSGHVCHRTCFRQCYNESYMRCGPPCTSEGIIEHGRMRVETLILHIHGMMHLRTTCSRMIHLIHLHVE